MALVDSMRGDVMGVLEAGFRNWRMRFLSGLEDIIFNINVELFLSHFQTFPDSKSKEQTLIKKFNLAVVFCDLAHETANYIEVTKAQLVRVTYLNLGLLVLMKTMK
ncbi:hypothetical protein Glove_71g19 [Diversispora epigaea]|uniref:Uncharacterized protein n=1 Tax=Diversispora epigaea TaxID=1348612 RepID=A0A397JC96_9GLOM|nr:hypothetical protein Glove_71g19 [Diversispora epigaea]